MNASNSFFNRLSESWRRSNRLMTLIRWLMPNGGTLLLVVLLVVTQSVWARPMQSVTSAPGPSATTVNYQGRLANSGGTPLTGTYGMTFALYDAATGGNLVWGPESHAAVPVSSGLFNVGLGSQTSGGIPTSVWNGDRYLEITVGGEVLAPRELIRSVPIAGMALTVPDGAINSVQIADGAVSAVDIASNAITTTKISDGAITTAKVVDGAITAAKIANGSVTQVKAPSLLLAPSNNQRVEKGSVYLTIQPGWNSNLAVTNFSTAFQSKPTIVIANTGDTSGVSALNVVLAATATGITWNVQSGHSSGTRTILIDWIAIGN